MYAGCQSKMAAKSTVYSVKVLLILCNIQVIAEGANGPITPMADKILQGNNVLVIPVSLCAGCVHRNYLIA